MACCNARAAGTLTASQPKAFRWRSCSCSSINASAAHWPTAAFTTNLIPHTAPIALEAAYHKADNAIEKLRKTMGATDPAKAEAGTIRKQFGSNIEKNAIHGSDGPDTAAFEISYFFNQLEIV